MKLENLTVLFLSDDVSDLRVHFRQLKILLKHLLACKA
jgi:hypothetical protein